TLSRISRMTSWRMSSGSSAFSIKPPKIDRNNRLSLFHIFPPGLTGHCSSGQTKQGARGVRWRYPLDSSLSYSELIREVRRVLEFGEFRELGSLESMGSFWSLGSWGVEKVGRVGKSRDERR